MIQQFNLLAVYSETDDLISDNTKIERVKACSGVIRSRARLTKVTHEESNRSKSCSFGNLSSAQHRMTEDSPEIIAPTQTIGPLITQEPPNKSPIKPAKTLLFYEKPCESQIEDKPEIVIRNRSRKVTASNVLKNPLETSSKALSPRKKRAVLKGSKKPDNLLQSKKGSVYDKVRLIGPPFRLNILSYILVVGSAVILVNIIEGSLFYTYGLHGKQVMNMIKIYSDQALIWLVNLEILRGLSHCLTIDNNEARLISYQDPFQFSQNQVSFLRDTLIERLKSYTKADLGKASQLYFNLINRKDYCELSSQMFPEEYPDCSLPEYSHLKGALVTMLKSHAAQFDRILDFMKRTPRSKEAIKQLMNDADVREYLPYSMKNYMMTDTFSHTIREEISPLIDGLLNSSTRIVAKSAYLMLGSPLLMLIIIFIYRRCHRVVLARISDYSSSFHFISSTMLLQNPWLLEFLKKNFLLSHKR